MEGSYAIGNLEGLPVEGAQRPRVDLEAATAEHAAPLGHARAVYAGTLGAPRAQGLLVGGSPVVGYARMLGEDPLLLLRPEAHLGQAGLQAARVGSTLLEVTGWPT